MLINRLIKPDSNLYKVLSNKSKQYDFFMDWDPLRWFGMWCMALSGFNIVKGSEYRYIFWDWSSGTGLIYLVLFTTIHIIQMFIFITIIFQYRIHHHPLCLTFIFLYS